MKIHENVTKHAKEQVGAGKSSGFEARMLAEICHDGMLLSGKARENALEAPGCRDVMELGGLMNKMGLFGKSASNRSFKVDFLLRYC